MDLKFDLQMFANPAINFTSIKTNDADADALAAGATGIIATDGTDYAVFGSTSSVTTGWTQLGTVKVVNEVAKGTAIAAANVAELKTNVLADITLADTDVVTAKSLTYVKGKGITAFSDLTYKTAGTMFNQFTGASGKVTLNTDKGSVTLNSSNVLINGSTAAITGLTNGTVTTSQDFNGTFDGTTVTTANTLGTTKRGEDVFNTIKAITTGQSYTTGDDAAVIGLNWSIVGSSGSDTLTTDTTSTGKYIVDGGAGQDLFKVATSGFVSLNGGADSDSFSIGGSLAADSSIYGGAGNDSVYVDANATTNGEGVLIDLGDGNDTLNGDTNANLGHNSTVLGGAGKDVLDFSKLSKDGTVQLYVDGGAEADKIVGNGAATKITNSTVVGGDGDDTIGGFDKSVTLEGGNGSDYFDISTGATATANIKDYKFGEDYIVTSAATAAIANQVATANGGLKNDGQVGFIDATATTADGLATISSTGGFFAATLVDAGSNKINLAWTGDTPVTVDASQQNISSVITGATNSEKDLLIGSKKSDTIYAGAGDSVYGGAGSDTIQVANKAGVYVGLSTAGGSDEVLNFVPDWDIEKGDVVVLMDGAEGLKGGVTGSDVTVKSGSASMKLTNIVTGDETKILLGDKKVDLIKKDAKAVVKDDDTIADYYVGTEKSGIDLTNYTGNVEVNLGTERFVNITTVQAGSGNVSILGAKGAESLVGGAGATSLYGGAGADTLKSGAGKTTFFGNEYVGKDIVQDFVTGTADDADVINVSAFSGITREDSSNFTVNVDGNNKLVVTQKNSGVDQAIAWESGDAKGALKVGLLSSDNTLTYENGVTNYVGGRKNDTVAVASGSSDSFNVWLDQTGNMFSSVEAYDFSGTSGSVLAAGKADTQETIIGGKGESSLWGGAGNGKDVLISSSGSATKFFYGLGDGSDSIKGSANDSVELYNLNLSEITKATIDGNNVVFTTTANETVTVSGGVKTFSLADGSSWTADYSKKSWTQN